MSATIITDAMVIPAPESQTEAAAAATKKLDSVEFAECGCCGLTEECTLAYIERIRERYQGKWICGLCAEAVKDEIVRCDERLMSTEDALTRHMNFCKKFSSSAPPSNPGVHLITAMRQLLRRSLDSPRSMPSSPTKSRGRIGGGRMLARSESCIPALNLIDSAAYDSTTESEGNE